MPIEARRETGFLLRLLQDGQQLSLPHSRPMPSIGRGCHELRVQAKNTAWRTIYIIDRDAIVVLEVFAKKTSQTPLAVIESASDGCAATTLRGERSKHEREHSEAPRGSWRSCHHR